MVLWNYINNYDIKHANKSNDSAFKENNLGGKRILSLTIFLLIIQRIVVYNVNLLPAGSIFEWARDSS